MKNTNKLIIGILFSISVIFGCTKDSFTFVAKWTNQYHFTGSSSGTFTSNLKSDGKWDYTEGATSQTNEGSWTSTGDSVSFTFTVHGSANYRGVKTGKTTMAGKIVFGGVDAGTWTGSK